MRVGPARGFVVTLALSTIAPHAPAAAQVAPGLPPGGPPALYAPEPAPSVPAGWTFPDAFPRTSGTSRLADGAVFWSGFLYDDHGARGAPVGRPIVGLSPPAGTFLYPPGPAHDNGADIAGAAVGFDGTDAIFRVDWQTLADVSVPIAVWGFDTDDDAATGADVWPAQAGVRSSGVEAWLLVSGHGAWLYDTAGQRAEVSTHVVDAHAGSFIARVPVAASGRWTVRLVAGLANEGGDAFAPVPLDRGSLPGQPRVYDVAFRTHGQEPLGADNWWREKAQAEALAAGNVSRFALPVNWSRLANKATTAERDVRGLANAWYRSSIDLGHGIAPPTRGYAADFAPNFLGRRQPYGIYVPEPGRGAMPLTVLLHSINVQHNQYAIWNPIFIEGACRERRSVCVAPLGRGADGWWAAEAELDLWEVWNRVAARYPLDPTRTVIAGYSMGGYGVYRLGLEHPNLFAAAVVLAGAPACSIRVVEGVEQSVAVGIRECDYESDTSELVGNARELPFYIGHDWFDELAPASSAIEQAGRFDALGFRHRLELYARDHVVWSMTGTFEGAVRWLEREDRRVGDAGLIDYTWYAAHERPDLGTGPSDVWWVGGLHARSIDPGALARIRAESQALRTRSPHVERRPDVVTNADGAALATELTWGDATEGSAGGLIVRVELTGVATASINLARAGLVDEGVLVARTDGTSLLELSGLTPGTAVRGPDGTTYDADAAGQVLLELTTGTATFRIGS